jgi:hypothetical protein
MHNYTLSIETWTTRFIRNLLREKHKYGDFRSFLYCPKGRLRGKY